MRDFGDENDHWRKRGLVGESIRVNPEEIAREQNQTLNEGHNYKRRAYVSSRYYKAHYRSYSRTQYVTRTVLGYDSFADTVELASNISPIGMVLCGLEEMP